MWYFYCPNFFYLCMVPFCRAYAFRLETSIRNLGLTVGTMFPRKALADILRGLCKRGAMFAILITDQDVRRESFTLTILKPDDMRSGKFVILKLILKLTL